MAEKASKTNNYIHGNEWGVHNYIALHIFTPIRSRKSLNMKPDSEYNALYQSYTPDFFLQS